MIVTLNHGRKNISDSAADLAMYLIDQCQPDLGGRYGEVFFQMKDLAQCLKDIYAEADERKKNIDIEVDTSSLLPKIVKIDGRVVIQIQGQNEYGARTPEQMLRQAQRSLHERYKKQRGEY